VSAASVVQYFNVFAPNRSPPVATPVDRTN
jgi:hypothetical protein